MSKLRRRVLILFALGFLAIVAAGYPRNELADRLIARAISAHLGLPVDCDGARLEGRAQVLTCARLAIGNPPGFGNEPLATFESVRVVLAGSFDFRGTPLEFGATCATLEVTVAASGENSLADALGAGGSPHASIPSVHIPRLDIAIHDAGNGLHHHIRDGQVGKDLANHYDVSGRVESAAGSGTFDLKLRDSALAFSAHGIDLAVLSPAIAPWFGGGSIAGRCDIELDVAFDRAAQRLAVAGEGNIYNPAALLHAISSTSALGGSRVAVRGSLEFDLAARRIDAHGFRLESDLLHFEADGAGTLDAAAVDRPLRVSASVGFDRGAQYYGPLLSALLGRCGIARATGDAQLLIGPDIDPSVVVPPGALRAIATTENFSLVRADGRALPVFGASFTGTFAFTADRVIATETVIGTNYATLVGSLEWRNPLGPTQDLAASLAGELFATKLIGPVVGWFGSLPLALNGEGSLALELAGVSPRLHGSMRYESLDTDVRFDHVRGSTTDNWNFRGMPLTVDATFALPLHADNPVRSFELEGNVIGKKAQIIRDEFDDLNLPFAWKDGSIALGPFTAGYFGGRANGRVEIDLEVDGPPVVRAELECVGSRLEHFVALVATGASGVLAAKYAPVGTRGANPTAARLTVSGSGNSISEVMESLAGDGVIECGAGTITGAPILEAWLPAAEGVEGRTISALRAAFRFATGTLVSDAAEVRAESRTLRLAGRCSASGILDFAIEPNDWLGPELFPRVASRLPRGSIGIRGPLSEPDPRLPNVSAWSSASDADLARLVAEFLAR